MKYMNEFALAYLLERFFYRIFIFIRNWYVGGGRLVMRETTALLESLDRTFALRANLANFFQPLYQDHSVIGHVLGLIFRSGRVIIGAILYGVIVFVAVFFYLAWALLPFYL